MGRRVSWLTLALVALTAFPAHAQETLTLGLNKNFGFAWGNQIQGNFTIRADGPADLGHVVFLIDGQPMGEAALAPFQVAFHTGSYAIGEHALSAVGETAGGDRISADALRLEFVSPDVGPQFVLRLLGPLLALLAVVMLAATAGPMLFGRGTFRAGHYGAAGGSVCPRCRLPFNRHVLAPNLMFGKLERCPHCGRVGIARRATSDELGAAEARLTGEGAPPPPVSETEQLSRQIEDSRYDRT
jgi:hypothetical protein